MKYLFLTAALLLTACSPKIVYVPVETCPAPKEQITMPQLNINSLPADANTKQKLEAWRLDFSALQFELKRCIVVLDGYRKE
jgi:hypothetical protein